MTSTRMRMYAVVVALAMALGKGIAGANTPQPEFIFKDVDLRLLEQVMLFERRLEHDGLVHEDAHLTSYLTRVGESLLPDHHLEHVTWRFRVLRDPLPNAFALPNGSIYVHSGLLGVLENEGQLAGVLAHEIAHVVQRHTYHSVRGMRKKALAINLLGFAGGVAGASQSRWGAAIELMASSAQVILVATISGYSRELERDADTVGLHTMHATGRDVLDVRAALTRLQDTHGLEAETIFYNSHPTLQARIDYVSEFAHRAQVAAHSASAAETDIPDQYRLIVQSVCRRNIEWSIDVRRYRSAVALARRLVADHPVSDHVYLLAEAYRVLGARRPEPDASRSAAANRKDLQRLKQRFTPEEEERELLSRPGGEQILEENRREAERLYREALALDSTNYRVHRGLGLLYERSDRIPEAAEAYRTYLAMGSEAPDRVYIARRLERLTTGDSPR